MRIVYVPTIPHRLDATTLDTLDVTKITLGGFILLSVGCTIAQLNSNSEYVLQTPFQDWLMAIVMVLLSGFTRVYTKAIIKRQL